MLYTTHVEKVILVSTIPSNLALDAPVNEETKKLNLLYLKRSEPVGVRCMHRLEHPCMHMYLLVSVHNQEPGPFVNL